MTRISQKILLAAICMFGFSLSSAFAQTQRSAESNSKTANMSAERAAEIEAYIEDTQAVKQVGAGISGCTDLSACNYNPSADADDGSCCFNNCVGITLTNGPIIKAGGGPIDEEPIITITDQFGIVVYSSFNAVFFEQLCLEDGCYSVQLPNASGWQLSVYDYAGGIFLPAKAAGGGGPGNSYLEVDFTNSALGAVVFDLGINSDCPAGCTIASACNYDPDAVSNDASCVFPACSDPTACNYSPFADCSCSFECLYPDECGECGFDDLTGIGNSFESIPEDNFTSPVVPVEGSEAFVFVGNDYIVLGGINNLDGDGGPILLALGGGFPGIQENRTTAGFVAPVDGDYVFDWIYATTDGPSYDIAYYSIENEEGITEFMITDEEGENNQMGTITIALTGGDLLTFGIDPTDTCCGAGNVTIAMTSSPVIGTPCTAGCNQSNACNYNSEATENDGSCIFGCLDPTAINFDPNSECSSFCQYVNECGDVVDEFGNVYGFSGAYAPGNWDVLAEGDSNVAFGPTSVVIKGIDENDEEGETSVSIVAPVSGEFSFHWCYTTEDEDPSYDPAFYINGVYTQLTDDSGLNFQNGTQTISVSAGDEIGFSVFTDDGCCGSGILVVDEFVSPGGTSCTPTCTGDLDEDGLIGGSDLLLFLAAFGTTCGPDVLVD